MIVRIRTSALCLAASMSLPVALGAEPFSGNDVLDACMGDIGAEAGFCYGFILGTVEGLKWGALTGVAATSAELPQDVDAMDVLSSVALGFCIPPNVENQQVIDVVGGYLQSNPASRHESARTLVQQALSSSFPC